MMKYSFTLLFICFIGFVAEGQTAAQYAKRITTHEKGVERIEKRDQQIDKSKIETVFAGSSSITGWQGFSLDFDTTKVLNNGFGGSRMSDLLVFFDRVITAYHPKQLFVYEGDNDLNGGMTVDEYLADVKAFARLVEVKLPGTKLYLFSIKPSPSRSKNIALFKEANARVEALAKASSFIEYIDITKVMYDTNGQIKKEIWKSDSLHMTRKGYELWTPIVKPYVGK